MRLSCCCYPLCGRFPTMGYVTPYMKTILPATKYFLKNSTEKMDTLFGLILFVGVIYFQSKYETFFNKVWMLHVD